MTTQRKAFEKWWSDNSLVTILGNIEIRLYLGMTKDTSFKVWQAALSQPNESETSSPKPVGITSELIGSNGGFSMCVFESKKVPLNTNLFLAPPNLEAKLVELKNQVKNVNEDNQRLTANADRVIKILEEKIAELEAKCEKMREALEFYAKRKHYSIFNMGNSYSRGTETLLKEDGEVARKALEECK